MNPIVVVLNGPNLNLLGKREPEFYGRETLADVEAECRSVGKALGLSVEFHQSNREYEIIDWIHGARERAAGIVTPTPSKRRLNRRACLRVSTRSRISR